MQECDIRFRGPWLVDTVKSFSSCSYQLVTQIPVAYAWPNRPCPRVGMCKLYSICLLEVPLILKLTRCEIKDTQLVRPVLVRSPSVDHELSVEVQDTIGKRLLRDIGGICGHQLTALHCEQIGLVQGVAVGVAVCSTTEEVHILAVIGGGHSHQVVRDEAIELLRLLPGSGRYVKPFHCRCPNLSRGAAVASPDIERLPDADGSMFLPGLGLPERHAGRAGSHYD